MHAFSEHELLRLTAEGDEQAFKELFQQYWPQVYGTSLHLTHSTDTAKDLAQDIFLKIWSNRTNLFEVQNLGGYIYRLSKNTVLDHLRKRVFEPGNIDLLIDYFNLSDAESIQEKLEYKELEATLQEAVNKLPDRIQEVFRLSRFEGLSHTEIAQKLNISVVTSKTYIVRALQAIREHLSSQSGMIVILMTLFLHHHKK